MKFTLHDLIRRSEPESHGYSRALQAARVRAAYQRSYFAPALFSLTPVVTDLIDSIRTYESGPCDFVTVDDGESDRNFATHFPFPENWRALSIPHPRRQFPERG